MVSIKKNPPRIDMGTIPESTFFGRKEGKFGFVIIHQISHLWFKRKTSQENAMYLFG
jgi:hypothetical protein